MSRSRSDADSEETSKGESDLLKSTSSPAAGMKMRKSFASSFNLQTDLLPEEKSEKSHRSNRIEKGKGMEGEDTADWTKGLSAALDGKCLTIFIHPVFLY